MKKKWLTAGVSFGIGGVMLLANGYSAMANTSGYDAYKSAVKNLHAETSMTENASLTVTDNGAKVFSGMANIKVNHQLNAVSVAAKISDGSKSHTLNSYTQDGKLIFKSGESDVYQVMEHNAPNWQHKSDAANPSKSTEQVIDALMGNIRELATVDSESDGSKQASLHLAGSQIPATLNVLGSLAISNMAGGNGWDHSSWHNADNSSSWRTDFHPSLPKLTDNIKVEKINLDANITQDNVLARQTAEIGISGTDASGTKHELVIQLSIDFSGFNQTTPEHIDLTGKQTVEIQNDWNKRSWHH